MLGAEIRNAVGRPADEIAIQPRMSIDVKLVPDIVCPNPFRQVGPAGIELRPVVVAAMVIRWENVDSVNVRRCVLGHMDAVFNVLRPRPNADCCDTQCSSNEHQNH